MLNVPEKPSEKSNHIIIEHNDNRLNLMRKTSKRTDEDNLMHIIHNTDNLEAIVWQVYDAGYRPNIKYGSGKTELVDPHGQ